MTAVEFGYYPRPIDFTSGDIRVSTLPDLDQTVQGVASNDGVEKGWIYAPRQESIDFVSDRISEHPYNTRVFGLPKTHTLEHSTADGDEHLSFLVWVLGFILGIRLSDTEAGFLDATPIEPGELHDMVLKGREVEERAIAHAERFWQSESSKPRVTKAVTGIIHAYFLAQYPRALTFERFMYLYMALDSCHFVHCAMSGKNPRSGTHGQRVENLCQGFGMPVPTWANSSAGILAKTRNETTHEALFFDEPLGFALYGGDNREARHELRQMKKLVCRFLLAILGVPDTGYIRSSVTSRNQWGVTL